MRLYIEITLVRNTHLWPRFLSETRTHHIEYARTQIQGNVGKTHIYVHTEQPHPIGPLTFTSFQPIGKTSARKINSKTEKHE